MNQPLAIVGASARAAAASAVRAGFQPVTADLFADLDLRSIATATRIAPYPEGFIDWLRSVEPPAWMYTGALENHPDLIDQMAWIAPLWGNAGDVLVRVRSPWQLGTVLSKAGLMFPETRRSPDGLPRDGTWLVKTYRGASGSDVWELAGHQEAGRERRSDANTEDQISLHTCFQRRISGIPCSANYVAEGGRAMLLGITRQLIGEDWLGARGFQYAGSMGPLPVTDHVMAEVVRLGQVLAEQFELTGLFGVDFICEDEKIWTLEVNPRYTASVEISERATGVNALAAHAQACLARPLADSDFSREPLRSFHGKAILFAKTDIVISERLSTTVLAEASRKPWPALADISPPGTLVEKGRPILTVFAEGRSIEDVENRLRNKVAHLEQRVYSTEVKW